MASERCPFPVVAADLCISYIFRFPASTVSCLYVLIIQHLIRSHQHPTSDLNEKVDHLNVNQKQSLDIK